MHKTNISDSLESAVVIAITGGIASGKSQVADFLRKRNFEVISTDILAKIVMETNPEVKKQIQSKFGNQTYSIDGKLNSKLLSEIVFGNNLDPDQISKLNSIVHPPTIEMMIAEVEKLILQGNRLVFVESALVFEATLDGGFDYIICVTADKETRINRAMSRLNISKDEVLKRMEEQLPQEEKIRLSDFEIQNNKTILDLEKSIDFLLPVLQFLPPKQNYLSEDDESE